MLTGVKHFNLNNTVKCNDNSEDENCNFLNSNDNYSKCYVCLEYTLYESPCKCKTPICNKCFTDILSINGKKCTICKNNYDDKILEDIEKNLLNLEIKTQDIELEENDYNSDDENFNYYEENRQFDDFCIFMKVFFFILSIPIFGTIFNYILGNKLNDFFSLENFFN